MELHTRQYMHAEDLQHMVIDINGMLQSVMDSVMNNKSFRVELTYNAEVGRVAIDTFTQASSPGKSLEARECPEDLPF